MEPGSLVPMEPVLSETVGNQAGVTNQVKWDGIRIIAFVSAQKVVLQTKGGKLKTNFPELNELASLHGQPLVLDGELVAIQNGRPDFGLILKRNFSSQPKPEVPIHYMAFDLLMHKGKDLRSLPLGRRKLLLDSLKFNPDLVSVLEDYPDGNVLFAGVCKLGWEGIVVKEQDSPYISGKSERWYKVKRVMSEKFTVVGYTLNQGQLASLLVARDFGAGLQLVGAVGSGLRSSHRRVFLALLTEAATKMPLASGKINKDWLWVKPVLNIEVEFREWTQNLTLRAPVFKKLYVGDKSFELPEY